jgi:murein DD-endopeptidase MepM/ murein hydrolase activator NlpD
MDYGFRKSRNLQHKYGRPKRRIRFPLLLLTAFGLIFWLVFLRPNTEKEEMITVPESVQTVPEIRRKVVEAVVLPGDTISSLLGDICTPQEIHNLSQECKNIFPLSKLSAGQGYRLSLLDGAFESLEFDIDRSDQLIIRQGEQGFEVDRIPIPYTVREVVVSATILANLFDAVVSHGESEALAVNLADIFAWDINFIRDIHPGDSFKVLVEKRFRDGEPAGYGDILAASFTNQGETFQAFLYKDGDQRAAYFNEEGKSLRKAFLKAPVSFSRISSGFSLRRFHPISKKWKAHPAIDYAAPTGTPIMAIGNGTISKIGHTKYNGNFIKLKHNNGMESLYLHMSRFAKNMKSGKRVSQGQTIGYVGSTGLATGPHLCFRMYKGGKPINPNKLKSVSAAPVSKTNMADFKTSITPFITRLEEGENPSTAKLPTSLKVSQSEISVK